jgi:glutamyl-tRNA synthetase
MRLLSDASRLLREITGPVDPASFVEELPESSEEVFAHTAGALEGSTIDDLQDARNLVGELRAWANERGIKARDLLHPLRLALTGRNRGPEMAHLFAVLGAREAHSRIETAREARLRA